MLWEIFINTLPGLSSGKELFVTFRSCWFLQMMDAQGSKERWEISEDKNFFALGGGQKWGFASQRTLVLHFWCFFCGVSCEECDYLPAGMMLWLDVCIASACLNFFIPFQQGWQMTTVFHLLPHQEAAHPLQVLLCQCPTSTTALSPGSQPPRSHLYRVIVCRYEILIIPPSVSSFQKFRAEGLIFCTSFFLSFFDENKLYKTQALSPVRNRTGCVLTPHSGD